MQVDRFQVFVTLLIYSLPGLVFGLALHELMHAVVTDRFGDPTPRRQGRLTLDPLTQIDPVGFALLVGVGFGWARPVQYNPLRIRTPLRQATVAFVGPATNLVIAVVLGVVLRVLVSANPRIAVPDGFDQFSGPPEPQIPYLGHGGAGYILFAVLFQAVFINALLFVFNMIPIPPLDGFAVLKGGLGRVIPDVIAWMERNRQLLFVGAIVVFFVLPRVGDNAAGNALISLTDRIVGAVYSGETPIFYGLDSLLGALSNR